jgi:alpha-galactosidase
VDVKYILVALFSTYLTASAADLTGHWVAETRGPDGEKRQTVFNFFTPKNGVVTGYMSGQQGDFMAMIDGKIEGDEITFAVMREFFGGERKTEYKGKLSGAGLTISMVPGAPPPGANAGRGPGRGGNRDMLAKRISSDEPKPMPPPPVKITTTEYKPVPSNGLAKTPPMGWNSWNKFQRRVSDQVVREIAAAMVKNGMRDAGYVYVNIDDTWEGTRDAQGNIQTNEKFPDMKALSAYVHSQGLKLGIYSSPGPKTCAGYEGSFNHEEQDAKTFAQWGIDYLKYDWCSARSVYDNSAMQFAYAKMGHALHDSGRAIVYSLCQYGLLNVGEWGPKTGGNLWRTTGDIRDAWASMADLGFDKQMGLEKNAGPGRWNDPDMLEIGNGAMSLDEYRTHMSLWSILASPLIAGNDVRDMTADVAAILMNKEVIDVDQDKLGKQGARVSKNGDVEVWARPLADGGIAVGLFNRGADHAKITAHWSDLGIKGAKNMRDLWAHEDRGKASDEFSADVPSHGVAMIKLR